MPAYLREPAAHLIAQFLPPFKGIWRTLPEHLIPRDVLFDGQNVSLLQGVLRSRQGILALTTVRSGKPVALYKHKTGTNLTDILLCVVDVAAGSGPANKQ